MSFPSVVFSCAFHDIEAFAFSSFTPPSTLPLSSLPHTIHLLPVDMRFTTSTSTLFLFLSTCILPISTASPSRLPRQVQTLAVDFASGAIGISNKAYTCFTQSISYDGVSPRSTSTLSPIPTTRATSPANGSSFTSAATCPLELARSPSTPTRLASPSVSTSQSEFRTVAERLRIARSAGLRTVTGRPVCTSPFVSLLRSNSR
jgi:hypothetical protein